MRVFSLAPGRPLQQLFFFVQAEDGIRSWSVTGVQTCALPIFGLPGYWTQVLLLLELHRGFRYGEAVPTWLPSALSPLNRWLVGNWRPELLSGAVPLGR